MKHKFPWHKDSVLTVVRLMC